MINVIHLNVHYNDTRSITALEIKLKSFENGGVLTGQALATTVSMALSQTTLLQDTGKSLKIVLNPKRNNVVDLIITMKKNNTLTAHDIANFMDHFQKAIDETKLF